jgi:hypothetical protein
MSLFLSSYENRLDTKGRISVPASFRASVMNENFAEIARRIPNCGVVSSDGLVLKADGLHFDAPSLRIFGKRYFEVYSNLTQNK